MPAAGQIKPFVQTSSVGVAAAVPDARIAPHRPVGAAVFEVSVLERAAAADAAVGDEIGRPDAEQVARTEVAVAVDADVFDRRVVVLLGVVERLFAEIGIVGPSADRISPFEDAIVDRDAVDFGVAPVRVVGSPRDEGDRLAAARIDVAVAEIKACGNIILVIDEVHNLVGAGDAEGSMNAANILKPALSRGEIQVIGATTFAEYRKYIEKDSALERRFQPVTVNEPSLEEAVAILRGVAHYYEVFHGVTIPPEMARQAGVLSERYITDRFLPDKAIDLLDEACSDLNLHSKEISDLAEKRKERDDYQLEIKMLTEDTEQQDNFERLAKLRSNVCRLDAEIAELEAKPAPVLTMENLARIIELWTKIPASKIRAQEYAQLRELEDRLKQHIIGQDEAVHAVAAAIRRNRVGIAVKKHPVSFIFVGSTGVGKTELVKCLANELFDSVDSLIRLDMSEYMERHSVSKLIGSPPGYVGYDEAGQLTEKIRRKPYSVILFDELEKAHPDVLNILLQILDDGRITDSQGRVVNFENTVIVMTSNAGSDRQGGSVGFGRTATEQGRDKAMKALSEFLRPEFLNRVDEIICFNRLSEENFRGIAAIMLGELKTALEEHGVALRWDESVIDYLVQKSYTLTYGARNLRRTIQKDIEDVVAEKLIDSYENPITAIGLQAQDGKLELSCL